MNKTTIIITTIFCTLVAEILILGTWAKMHPPKIGIDYPYTHFKLPDDYGIPYDSVQIVEPFNQKCEANLCYPKEPSVKEIMPRVQLPLDEGYWIHGKLQGLITRIFDSIEIQKRYDSIYDYLLHTNLIWGIDSLTKKDSDLQMTYTGLLILDSNTYHKYHWGNIQKDTTRLWNDSGLTIAQPIKASRKSRRKQRRLK